MRPSSFEFKTRIYAAITVLLFVYVEWVNCCFFVERAILLLKQGVF